MRPHVRAELDYLLDPKHVPEPFHMWLQRRFPKMVWDEPHHLAIFDALQLLDDGAYNKLIILMPPQHGKSTMVTERYSAWRMRTYAQLRAMVISYNLELSRDFADNIRTIMIDDGELSNERGARADFKIKNGSHLRAYGMLTGITGRPAEWVVIDDPIKGPEDADSVTFRDKVWKTYQNSITTRLNPGWKMCLIQTRWHLDDLAGRLMEHEPGEWEVLHLPALAMEDDPLNREVGEALWEWRKSAPELEVEKVRNPRGFWALYQGMPQPEGGAIFLPDWWDASNRFSITDQSLINLVAGRYQFWDTAEETGENNAYTSCTTFDVMPDYTVNVREVWRKRLTFPELLPAVINQAQKHNRDEKLNKIVIEYASSGRGLYQTLETSAPSWIKDNQMLARFSPKASKEDRAKAAALWCANRLVRLPHPDNAAPWLHDFEKELFTFPQSIFKDQVDSFVMGIDYLRDYLSQALEARGMHYE